jgi:hypothetical protein
VDGVSGLVWGAVEAVVDEYIACGRGRRRDPVGRERLHGGAVEICGDVNGGSLTFVRGDGALVVLDLASPQQALDRFAALHRGPQRYWEAEPASVQFAGTRRFFRPLGGGRALGVVECDGQAVVLGQVEGRLVLVLVHGASRILISTAGPQRLGAVDVDAHVELLPPRAARTTPTLPPPTRQQHARIHQGRELSQESSDVICMALQRLGLRATVVVDPARFGPRHRGKRAVMAFIDLLITLGLMRCGDLCGRASDIIKQIRRYIPDVDISAAKLGEVLKLLHATGTCLIERPTQRTWRIRLAELDDVKGALHQAFCEETPTHFHLLPVVDPAARRLCGFDRGDLARKSRQPRDVDAAPKARREEGGADANGPVAGEPGVTGSAEPAHAGTPSGAPLANDDAHRTASRPRSGSPSEPAAASGHPPPAAPVPNEPGLPRTDPAPASASPASESRGPSPLPRHGWSALGDKLSQRMASVAGSSITIPVRADRVDTTTSGPDPPPGATREPDSKS